MTIINSMKLLRPVSFFIFLAAAAVIFSSCLLPAWVSLARRAVKKVDFDSDRIHLGFHSQVKTVAKLLHPLSSSATNLPGVLSSSLNLPENLSFSHIETRVVPLLFQALTTIPHLTEVSYVGLDGLSFSYYSDGNQILALYSNSTTFGANWYVQFVNPVNGKLYGRANTSTPYSYARWLGKVLNSTDGYAFVEAGWRNSDELLFLNAAGLNGRGAISLGFSVKTIMGFFTEIDLNGADLYFATKDGKMLMGGLPSTHMFVNGDSVSFQLAEDGNQKVPTGDVVCGGANGTLKLSRLDIEDTEYDVYCSSLDIVGVPSVYALAFKNKEIAHQVHKDLGIALTLLILMIIVLVLAIASFIVLGIRDAKREMHLCASLIKQMEATQQAERKSMNKSQAIASASHDIRAHLSGITGLIDLCYPQTPPHSDLHSHLRKIKSYTEELLDLLNSILDTSKIEAGKMQLDEEEFNLAQFLEDAVDLYHPVGMKKGVDVILDPCDGSIIKFSQVKGDRGKLKQVISNLLSNAVKFTPQGHVSVRAWAKKPSLHKSMIASNQGGTWNYLSCLFGRTKEAKNDLDTVKTIQHNPNAMEFIFEVDDTGKGIPMEKRNSVFENFVQVKETALEHGGTGLGLGIVQSVVRLMGGEIGFVEKERGESGTCFRFNIFLTVCNGGTTDNAREDDAEQGRGDDTSGSTPHLGLTVLTPGTSLTSRSPSSASPRIALAQKPAGSQVVLMIQNGERQKAVHRFMERLGIKVLVAHNVEHLHSTLRRVKRGMNHSNYSLSGRLEPSSRSDSSHHSIGNEATKDLPLSAMDGTDHVISLNRKVAPKGASRLALIVIDTSTGPLPELQGAVTEFKKGLCGACKTVWLERPDSRRIEENARDRDDIIISKPFHGSRLSGVIRILSEFGGSLPELQIKQDEKGSVDPGPSMTKRQVEPKSAVSSPRVLGHPIPAGVPETENAGSNVMPSSEKQLSGKKVLLVEDNTTLQMLASKALDSLGAIVELCSNGQEAVNHVAEGFNRLGDNSILPYDYILMDCEMPVMNGYDATKQIREEERHYGVHIPIIALTAHTGGDEAKKTMEVGMDLHLGKPIKEDRLLEAISKITK